MTVKTLADLSGAPYNPRTISEKSLGGLKYSMAEFGDLSGIVFNERTGCLVAGHQRTKGLRQQYGDLQIVDGQIKTPEGHVFPVRVVDWPIEKEKAANVAANATTIQGSFTADLSALVAEIEVDMPEAFSALDLDTMISELDEGEGDAEPVAEGEGNKEPETQSKSLAERFGVPPFSVLDARQGYWQDRKRAWLSLGIQSEIGRGGVGAYPVTDSAAGVTDSLHEQSAKRGLTWSGAAVEFDHYRVKEGTRSTTDSQGTSIFDPVLCELAYRWFCPPGGVVLDPFAGGSVRGVVASRCGREYVGAELRTEQVEANRIQGERLCDEAQPVWITGDSRNIQSLVGADLVADLVFSCPPYADLEVYSDDPADLSTMDYPAFLAAYRKIIAESCALLRDDRFACFVVGDVRDKRGNYRNFVADTIQAFLDSGLHLYNEAVLVTALGSLPLRAGKQFAAGRKLGKTHQNVLVFVKGDGRRAADAVGPVEFGETEPGSLE